MPSIDCLAIPTYSYVEGVGRCIYLILMDRRKKFDVYRQTFYQHSLIFCKEKRNICKNNRNFARK